MNTLDIAWSVLKASVVLKQGDPEQERSEYIQELEAKIAAREEQRAAQEKEKHAMLQRRKDIVEEYRRKDEEALPQREEEQAARDAQTQEVLDLINESRGSVGEEPMSEFPELSRDERLEAWNPSGGRRSHREQTPPPTRTTRVVPVVPSKSRQQRLTGVTGAPRKRGSGDIDVPDTVE